MIALLRPIAVVLATIVGGVGLTTSAALAPAVAQTQLPEQVQLTPELVEAFIASYPELHELGQQLEQKYGKAAADPEDPTSFVTGYLQNAEAMGLMQAIVQRHGISTIQDWVHVAYSVILAYSFAERGEGGGSVDNEMAQAIEQIKTDKSIPEPQKQILITQLQQQMAAISQLRPPPGNIEAVTPYVEQIKPIVDAD